MTNTVQLVILATALTLPLAAAAGAPQDTARTSPMADNPFAQPSTLAFQLPPFDRIRDADYLPAYYRRGNLFWEIADFERARQDLDQIDRLKRREAVLSAEELTGRPVPGFGTRRPGRRRLQRLRVLLEPG